MYVRVYQRALIKREGTRYESSEIGAQWTNKQWAISVAVLQQVPKLQAHQILLQELPERELAGAPSLAPPSYSGTTLSFRSTRPSSPSLQAP